MEVRLALIPGTILRFRLINGFVFLLKQISTCGFLGSKYNKTIGHKKKFR